MRSKFKGQMFRQKAMRSNFKEDSNETNNQSIRGTLTEGH